MYPKSAQVRAQFDGAARRLLAAATLVAAANAFAQPVEIDIKNGNSIVPALVFGPRISGEHTVIALHGARPQKELFWPIAPGLVRRGYKVISIRRSRRPARPRG